MKTPRVNDFDPNAAPGLRSPLDDMPAIERPKATSKQPISGPDTLQESREAHKASVDSSPTVPEILRANERPLETAVPIPPQNPISEPPPARTPVRPYGSPSVRRTITRYAFEFFQDQIETLRQFSLDEKLRGEKGSMSEMIREAVDSYISRRRNREEA